MNLEEYGRRWKRAPENAIREARRAANEGLEDTVQEIRESIVPYEEGTLAESIRVEDLSTPEEIRLDISAGSEGPAEAYASVQEERRDFHHPGGRKAGYIGDTVRERRESLTEEAARGARKGLRESF